MRYTITAAAVYAACALAATLGHTTTTALTAAYGLGAWAGIILAAAAAELAVHDRRARHAARPTTRRPTEVAIGGRTYGVQPLTMPTLAAMNAPELLAPVQHLAAAAGPFGDVADIDGDAMMAAWDAMYGQLRCLLVDQETGEPPPLEHLQAYLPVNQLSDLLTQLGPGGAT